ncbi:MAG: transport protein TonB [Lacunisphaera sp.]|nr:transport protein TonB [Lacunisphaera sp.]
MNIQKFKWPAIIAAGLHGALFSLNPDRIDIVPPSDKPIQLAPIPTEPIKMETEPARADESVPAGSQNPLPQIPENPAPPVEKPNFPMETTERAAPFDTRDLRRIDNRPPGAVDGLFKIAVPHVVGVGLLDHTPRARVQRAPDYPRNLSNQGVSGSVTVEFEVNTRGEVVRAEAVNFTEREFVEPALRAVRSWRFEPGRRHGQVVPFRMVVPIEFGLEPG